MPVITISRGSLSGGEKLAQLLHERLGYRVISREVIVEAAREYGIDEARIVDAMQVPQRLLQRLGHQKERYVCAVQATLAEMIEDGRAIYHGQAGQFLLQGLPNVIKIRLIAPAACRVEIALQKHGLNEQQALEEIARIDERRARWVRQMYGADWADPALYDAVFNLAQVSVETAAEIISTMASRPEYLDSAESRQQFSDFALRTRITAALTFKSDFPDSAVEMVVREGSVYVEGGRYFEGHKQVIVDFVRAIPGVTRVVADGDEAPATTSNASAGDVTKRRAAEVMVPIEGYPHIRISTTIREAMVALGASSVQLEDGFLLAPRYVLVLDEAGRLAGVLGRRNLLRGLLPQFTKPSQPVGGGMFFTDFKPPSLSAWVSFFSPRAVTNAREPVRTVLAQIRGTVDVDDDLNAVVSVMLDKDIDLVPVMNGERVAGVVLMSDVFDVIAEYVVQHGGPKGSPPRPAQLSPSS